MAERRLPRAGVGGPDAAEVRHDLALVREALERMSSLARRSLQEDVPGYNVFADEQPLSACVARVIGLCMHMADEHDAVLHWHIDETAALLPTRLLEPVLLNVLRNAIEATASVPEGDRRVELTITQRSADQVVVCVCDSGPGFDPGELGTSGNGIGLELCRTLMQRMGGTLEIINAPYGRGTVVSARVPVARLMAS